MATITMIVTINNVEATRTFRLDLQMASVLRGSTWGPGFFIDPDQMEAAFFDRPMGRQWKAIFAESAGFIAEAINCAINEADCRFEMTRDLGLETPIFVSWTSRRIDEALAQVRQ
jgi:hypothetical protein